jgi:hypothetical protein
MPIRTLKNTCWWGGRPGGTCCGLDMFDCVTQGSMCWELGLQCSNPRGEEKFTRWGMVGDHRIGPSPDPGFQPRHVIPFLTCTPTMMYASRTSSLQNCGLNKPLFLYKESSNGYFIIATENRKIYHMLCIAGGSHNDAATVQDKG